MSKVCYYYQTFKGLDKLLSHMEDVDVIIVSSIHFGVNKDASPYIHLNDEDPNSKIFDGVWNQTKLLSENNTEIILMVGGAGSAYNTLFSNYDVYFKMLVDTVRSHNWITGIDLDIEENVNLSDIKRLINDIISEFGENFTITMAPLAGSLMEDEEGMGGFIYKELYLSPEGKHISWFNVQSYGEYSLEIIDKIVENKYPPDKLVLGMLSGQFTPDNFKDALNEVAKIKNKYTSFGGVYDWEYFNSPPRNNNPSEWAYLMKEILKDNTFYKKIINYFSNYMKEL